MASILGSGPQFIAAGNGSQYNNTGPGAQYINSKVYTGYEDEQNRKCLQDLRQSDPRDDKRRIESTKGGLFHGASDWILSHNDFLRWKNGDLRLLWIKGDPGKGKTMLLISITEELERQPEPTKPLSYFFCQGTSNNLNNATSVLRGLIYLLAKGKPQLISHIRQKYDDTGPRIFQDDNSFFALSEVLESILRDESLTTIYLIVDALDECTTNCDLLLKLIMKQTAITPRVKWIVSSRNRPEIDQDLMLDRLGAKLALEITANAELVAGAVDNFIDFKLSKLFLLQHNDSMRLELRELMRERADGTFLWVALVAQELKKADPWDMVDIVSRVPSDLYELYNQILNQIRQQAQWKYCQALLSVVTLAYRPLSIPELASISGLPEKISSYTEHMRRIIALCGSFLTVQEDGIVYLIHQSVKDYLSDRVAGKIFPAGHTQTHHEIMQRSLEIMRGTLRRDIYNLRQLGISINEVKEMNPDPLISVRYSCIHWINHFCDSSNGELCKNGNQLHSELVGQFFQQIYLYWLEALSLLHSIGDGVISLTRLRNLLKEQLRDQQLIDIAEDSYRFIRQNRWVIENAPLQTYVSALIFSPTESLIRKLFTKEEPDWIRIKPLVVRNWSLCQQTLEGHRDSVRSVAFSPDSKLVASGSSDSTIMIWEAATGALQQKLEGHIDRFNSVAFSPDSKLVASGSFYNAIKIWEATTGNLKQTLVGHGDSVNSVTYSSDTKLVASGSSDKTVKIWEADTGTLKQTLKGHGDPVCSVDFSPDSKLVASGSSDKTVKIWEADIGTLKQTLEGHGSCVCSVAFSPDSNLVASGSYDHTVKIWEVATGAVKQTLEGHRDSVCSVAISSDSKLVVSGSHDKTVKIWEAATGTLQQTLEGHSSWVSSVDFSPDFKLVTSGSDDRTVRIWEAATGAPQQMLEEHGNWVLSMAFSPDSNLVASGSDDRTVKIWEVATGAVKQTLEGHSGSVHSVAFSSDSKLVVSGSINSTVKIWEVATGAIQQTLEGHSNVIHSVAFSPDLKLVASGSLDKTVKIWEAATGALKQTLEGHGGTIYSVAFSPDSKLVVSESNDKTVKIWEAATGTLQRTLERHSDEIHSVAFSRSSLDLNEVKPYSYSMTSDHSWISWSGQKQLWLPPDYRPVTSVTPPLNSPSMASIIKIALGMPSGRVTIIGLLASGPNE